jgi:hypothetical protein
VRSVALRASTFQISGRPPTSLRLQPDAPAPAESPAGGLQVPRGTSSQRIRDSCMRHEAPQRITRTVSPARKADPRRLGEPFQRVLAVTSVAPGTRCLIQRRSDAAAAPGRVVSTGTSSAQAGTAWGATGSGKSPENRTPTARAWVLAMSAREICDPPARRMVSGQVGTWAPLEDRHRPCRAPPATRPTARSCLRVAARN